MREHIWVDREEYENLKDRCEARTRALRTDATTISDMRKAIFRLEQENAPAEEEAHAGSKGE